MLTVQDLSPNMGVLWWEPENISNLMWSNLILSLSIRTYKFFSLMLYCRYFFAEVFDFFRNFFLIVFHGNILFMILPLAIRLKHRPFFLAFVYIVISSMLKSYPSVSSYLFELFTRIKYFFVCNLTHRYGKLCSFRTLNKKWGDSIDM